MPIPRVYLNEPCPLDGYDDLTVRVLGNATDSEWRVWATGNLGAIGCEKCAKLNQPRVARGKQAAPPAETGPRRYCESCTQARQRYGQSIVLFYGPDLLGHAVSTPEQALRLFDDDDSFPSEIVIWLQLLPSQVRERRQQALLGNLTGSLTTPAT